MDEIYNLIKKIQIYVFNNKKIKKILNFEKKNCKINKNKQIIKELSNFILAQEKKII